MLVANGLQSFERSLLRIAVGSLYSKPVPQTTLAPVLVVDARETKESQGSRSHAGY